MNQFEKYKLSRFFVEVSAVAAVVATTANLGFGVELAVAWILSGTGVWAGVIYVLTKISLKMMKDEVFKQAMQRAMDISKNRSDEINKSANNE